MGIFTNTIKSADTLETTILQQEFIPTIRKITESLRDMTYFQECVSPHLHNVKNIPEFFGIRHYVDVLNN
jgi:hypothetical protein